MSGILEVKNLKTYFRPRGLVKALDDISFELKRQIRAGRVGSQERDVRPSWGS